MDESQLPAVMVPAEPERPDMQYERDEVKARVRNAIATLPPREQRVIALYYYNEVTMKDIGAELGVNESRVSQLHARAIKRLREALGAEITPMAASAALRAAFAAFDGEADSHGEGVDGCQALVAAAPDGRDARRCPSRIRACRTPRRSEPAWCVVSNARSDYDQDNVSRAARSKSPNLKGLESQRQPVSSRKRSASVPATSPVTKMTRRASAGVAAAIAR